FPWSSAMEINFFKVLRQESTQFLQPMQNPTIQHNYTEIHYHPTLDRSSPDMESDHVDPAGLSSRREIRELAVSEIFLKPSVKGREPRQNRSDIVRIIITLPSVRVLPMTCSS